MYWIKRKRTERQGREEGRTSTSKMRNHRNVSRCGAISASFMSDMSHVIHYTSWWISDDVYPIGWRDYWNIDLVWRSGTIYSDRTTAILETSIYLNNCRAIGTSNIRHLSEIKVLEPLDMNPNKSLKIGKCSSWILLVRSYESWLVEVLFLSKRSEKKKR